MNHKLVQPLELQIEAISYGYVIRARYVGLGWWPEAVCFTLWGARRKANQLRKRLGYTEKA